MSNPPTISACLIVRNEERFLEACLASIADQADEIVIVDTGSHDRSMEIARQHGARVLEQAWTDDFAAARNTGLDAATGEWILYIDADERLSLPPGQHLADGLAEPTAFAALVRFIPTLNSTQYREYRLFRNDRRLRFRGAMHETIMPDLEELRRTAGASVIDSAATITHLGYEGDLTHKFRRNLPWLRASVAREPGRLYYWYDLARSLAGLGENDEALQVATEALERAKDGANSRDFTVGSAIADILASLCKARGEDPLPAIEAGLALKPDQPRLLFLKAEVLVELGRLEEACVLLDQIASVDVETFIDPSIAYDRRLFTFSAPHLLGTTLLRLGRVRDGARALARAAAAIPDKTEYASNVRSLTETSRLG